MRVGALLSFVIFVLLAASCGGQSSSNGGGDSASAGGGTNSGGNGGTGLGGNDENCDDERRALRELINANKACSDTSQCVTQMVGCGITEDGCTGAVYTNDAVDTMLFDDHRLRFTACLAQHEGIEGCPNCEREARAPTCSEGRCVGASACELEAAALRDFKSRNDACETSSDCTAEFVGCDVTEDDCTGAVYYAADFDRAGFLRLRDEYYACAGTCGACLRVASPPGCVSGHCQILPIR